MNSAENRLPATTRIKETGQNCREAATADARPFQSWTKGPDMKRSAFQAEPVSIITGHEAFDSQVVKPAIGPRIVGAQTSIYVAAASEVYRAGRIYRRGELREIDLDGAFEKRDFGTNALLRRQVLGSTDELPAYLYAFHHMADNKRYIHGFVLTRTAERLHEFIKSWTTGSEGSGAVIETMAQHVANPPGSFSRFMTYARSIGAKAASDTLDRASPDARLVGEMILNGAADAAQSGDFTEPARLIAFSLGDDSIVLPTRLEPAASELRNIIADMPRRQRTGLVKAFAEIESLISAGIGELIPTTRMSIVAIGWIGVVRGFANDAEISRASDLQHAIRASDLRKNA